MIVYFSQLTQAMSYVNQNPFFSSYHTPASHKLRQFQHNYYYFLITLKFYCHINKFFIMGLLTLLKNMSCSLLSYPLIECSREQMYFKKRNAVLQNCTCIFILSLPLMLN